MSKMADTKGMTVKEKLDYYSIPEPNSGCWLWIGAIGPKDYGSIYLNGKMQRAHRASYEAYYGEIPKGIFVCHRCDMPACVNPDHLFLGTAMDNKKDSMKKGRHSRGDNSGTAKLNSKQVTAIYKDVRVYRVIANDYNVSLVTVENIKRGRSWKSLGLIPIFSLRARNTNIASLPELEEL